MTFRSPISLDQLPSDFNVKRSTEYGEELLLVTPNHIGCTWTPENLIFRSSVWTSDGYLVSPSFKKFFNWHEKDNIVAPPDSLVNSTVVEKIDGSTLVVSPFKGKTIIRTRGTFNVNIFENATDVDFLKKKYPRAFAPDGNVTYLYEWYSPSNKIVLNYGETPEIHLIGAIYHDSYRLFSQSKLDDLAGYLGVLRPPTYSFEETDDLLKTISALKGKEGVCVYYNNDQCIKKVKSVAYLSLHAFKSELSINNLLDVYIDAGMPDYSEFYEYIATKFDFECAEAARGQISILADAKKTVSKIVDHMGTFVAGLKVNNRREAAERILGAYGNTNRAGFVFSIFDGKQLKPDDYKKLYHQVIPK